MRPRAVLKTKGTVFPNTDRPRPANNVFVFFSLYVVYICLTIFCKDMFGSHLKFELDNMTAVSYINQMGGSKSVACDSLAKKIWNWCIPRNIWLTAVHIPGSSNVIADSLSRRHSDYEWMLNGEYFVRLCGIFPNLSIDLFASTLNYQLPRYAAWKPDPNAVFTDVLVDHGRMNMFRRKPCKVVGWRFPGVPLLVGVLRTCAVGPVLFEHEVASCRPCC